MNNEFLLEVAYGIIDLVEENNRLKRENLELRKRDKEHTEQVNKGIQDSMKWQNDILNFMLNNKVEVKVNGEEV